MSFPSTFYAEYKDRILDATVGLMGVGHWSCAKGFLDDTINGVIVDGDSLLDQLEETEDFVKHHTNKRRALKQLRSEFHRHLSDS